jgi:hypothetical protein
MCKRTGRDREHTIETRWDGNSRSLSKIFFSWIVLFVFEPSVVIEVAEKLCLTKAPRSSSGQYDSMMSRRSTSRCSAGMIASGVLGCVIRFKRRLTYVVARMLHGSYQR